MVLARYRPSYKVILIPSFPRKLMPLKLTCIHRIEEWEVSKVNLTERTVACHAPDQLTRTAILNHQISFEELVTICDTLEGKIPVANSQQKYEEVTQNSQTVGAAGIIQLHVQCLDLCANAVGDLATAERQRKDSQMCRFSKRRLEVLARTKTTAGWKMGRSIHQFHHILGFSGIQYDKISET
jgi:hypothetical protein